MAKPRIYPFRPPLKRNQYEAIGMVATQWAYFETEVDLSILHMLALMQQTGRTVRDDEIALIKPLSQRTQQLKSIAKEFYNSDPHYTQLGKILDAGSSLKDDRDSIVHGLWYAKVRETQETSDDIFTQTFRLKSRPNIRDKHMRSSKMRAIAQKISKVNRDLRAFNLAHLHRLPAFPPGTYRVLRSR